MRGPGAGFNESELPAASATATAATSTLVSVRPRAVTGARTVAGSGAVPAAVLGSLALIPGAIARPVTPTAFALVLVRSDGLSADTANAVTVGVVGALLYRK